MFDFNKYLSSDYNRHDIRLTDVVNLERLVPKELHILLDTCNIYDSAESVLRDLLFQLIKSGFILKLPPTGPRYLQSSLADNFLFVARHHGKLRLGYIILLRFLTFRFGLPHFKRLMQVTRLSKIDTEALHEAVQIYNRNRLVDYTADNSRKVSVIIPTLNRYKYLKRVLYDLSCQTYSNFEVIIVDQSDNYNDLIYRGYKFEIKVLRQKEKELWRARNTAIKHSTGELILLYDDDSIVNKDWISNHIKIIDCFDCDISSGVSLSQSGGKVPNDYSYIRLGTQIDTGNVMLKRIVFEKTGLFDCQFEKQRQGDGEFAVRASRLGFINVSNPLASRLHLKVRSGGLREMGSWDAWRPTKFFSPRPVPSIIYLDLMHFGLRKFFLDSLIKWPSSLVPYRLKGARRTKKIPYLVIFVLLFPLMLVFFIWSLLLAQKMKKNGPLIDKI